MSEYPLGAPLLYHVQGFVQPTWEPVLRRIACPRVMTFGTPVAFIVVSNFSTKQCVRAQLPIPWNTLYTVDFINEMTIDHVCPEGVLTIQDLGVDPRPVRGTPNPLETPSETLDNVCPEGVLTCQDLGVDPRPVRSPVEAVASDGTFACFLVTGLPQQIPYQFGCVGYQARGPSLAGVWCWSEPRRMRAVFHEIAAVMLCLWCLLDISLFRWLLRPLCIAANKLQLRCWLKAAC